MSCVAFRSPHKRKKKPAEDTLKKVVLRELLCQHCRVRQVAVAGPQRIENTAGVGTDGSILSDTTALNAVAGVGRVGWFQDTDRG